MQSVNNKFQIPDYELAKIRERDALWVYCRKVMIYPYDRRNGSDSATIEHLSPEPPYYWLDGMKIDNIVICCGGCNSSRGAKHLRDWFRTNYCTQRLIGEDTVARPVKEYLLRLAEPE
jgi:hypothetical protein